MSIDIGVRHLRAAVAVAKAGGYTAAARELHVAQSSLSRTVLETEQRLGVPLFDRTTRQVVPTVDGLEFLRVARRVLREYDAALTHFDGYLAGQRGSVSVAALPSIAATLLPPVISAFREARSEVTVVVQDGISGEVRELVESGAVDMAVTVATAVPPGFSSQKIAADTFACVFSPQHRFARQRKVSWSDLAGEPFVAFDETSSIRWHSDRLLQTQGIELGPMTEARNIGAVAGLTGAGLGVTVAPGLVIPMMRFADLDVRPLADPEVKRDICLLHHPDRPLSRTAKAFMHLLVNARAQGFHLPDKASWTG